MGNDIKLRARELLAAECRYETMRNLILRQPDEHARFAIEIGIALRAIEAALSPREGMVEARDAFEKIESYVYGLENKALADIRPAEVQNAFAALEAALSLEAIRMAYKTGYAEGIEDGGSMFDRQACEEGWQQYREGIAQ